MDSECTNGGTCDMSTLLCSCASGYSGANCGTGKISSNFLHFNSGSIPPFTCPLKSDNVNLFQWP